VILVGIALILLAVLGAPLFAIIAAGALIGFAGSDIDLMVVPMEIFRVSEIPVLIAIPLFTFAGYLLGESNAPKRLVRVTNVLLGWMPGGLAVVALFVCLHRCIRGHHHRHGGVTVSGDRRRGLPR
jgi:TRAP-type mannitol/chloroaromatic compound transport system permease large subunit